MKSIGFALLVLALGAGAPALACDEHDDHGKKPARTASKSKMKASPFVPGEVREVDVDEGTLTLAHGRIPSLGMAPMSSMQLRAARPRAIAGLNPGDKVEFRVATVDERLTVTEIRRPQQRAPR